MDGNIYGVSPPRGGPPPSAYHQDHRNSFSQQQAQQYPASQPEHRETGRARASSVRSDVPPNLSNYGSPKPAPINEAVSSAFDNVNTSNFTPDIVAQITEDVIRRLKNAGLENVSSSSASNPSAPAVQPAVRNSSGSSSPVAPHRTVYTPPSPRPRSEQPPGFGSPKQTSMSTFSDYDYRGPQSPRDSQNGFVPDKRSSSPMKSQRGGSPTRSVDSRNNDPPSLKPQSSRMFTDVEETTLDKIWTPLFDSMGRPTERLGQLLRGLAHHLIDDFEPKNSIVVTPRKMSKYYERFKIDREVYDFGRIFDGHSAEISKMYCDLECQHHLVQRSTKQGQTPFIPGLTPVGFAKWMQILLLAHPDEEVERLQKAIMDLPIDNPDAVKEQERFPKEVSRHLFPKKEDRAERSRFRRAAWLDDPDETPRPSRAETVTNSKSMSSATPIDIPRAASIERERQPYSSVPRGSAVEEIVPPISIERERKPYSAQPGGGKTYDDEKPDLKPASRPARASSNARPPPPMDHGQPFPEPRHVRTSSNANQPPRRQRSPSFSRDGGFRRSDNDLTGYHSPAVTDADDDQRWRAREPDQKRSDWARRQAEEEVRSNYDASRDRDKYVPMPDVGSPPNRGFDEDYYRSNGRGSGPGYDYPQPQYPTNHR